MVRRWLFWFLIVAFLVLAVIRFTEIEELVETLSQGRWEWVLACDLFYSSFFAILIPSIISDLSPFLDSSVDQASL
jgi:hypothetical protein